MKIFTNKYFILGNLVLILAAIPLTLFFVKQQQDVRSKAAASSKLYFQPNNMTSSTSCTSFTSDIMLDPGTNLVSLVTLVLTYDPTKVEITQITPSQTFDTVQTPSSISNGKASITLDAVGGDVTKAVTQVTKVATITFVPKGVGSVQVKFDTTPDTGTEVLSLSSGDDPNENVLSTSTPLSVAIDANACGGGGPGTTPGTTPGTNPGTTPGATATPNPLFPPVTTAPSGFPGLSGTPRAATGSSTLTPTTLPTIIPTTLPTVIPTAVPTVAPTTAPLPTLADTGSFGQTVGILAGVVLVLGVGFFLLAL